MNNAISAAQGPPPYSPSSPGEIGDGAGLFDFSLTDDEVAMMMLSVKL